MSEAGNFVERTGGIIFGPAPNSRWLWIGRIPPYEGDVYNRDFKEAREIPSQFKESEFYLDHTYRGSSCDSVRLHGVFFAGRDLRSEKIAIDLNQLSQKYFKRPFRSVRPTLDEMVTVRDELRAIGPLDMSFDFRSMGEAYLPFAGTESLYQWLRQNFRMIARILDTNRLYSSIKVIETAELPWRTLSEFTNWLLITKKIISLAKTLYAL